MINRHKSGDPTLVPCSVIQNLTTAHSPTAPKCSKASSSPWVIVGAACLVFLLPLLSPCGLFPTQQPERSFPHVSQIL